MLRIIAAVLFSLLVMVPSFAWAEDPGRRAVVYLFWGDGCPHCEHEKPFLQDLRKRYPALEIRDHEVWNDLDNKELFRKISGAYGLDSGSVPATFIDFRSWIGFNPQIASEIEEAVGQCVQFGCLDPASVASPARSSREEAPKVSLPWAGEIDARKIALPLLTLVLAGLDGFNPCAFFVLLMLLSLMTHARSRARMLIVGGVFVFFSGFVYFLFMAAWLNLFMVTGRVFVITAAAGALAVVMAVINIKEYFFFKQGVSLTITASARGSLLSRMRALITAGSTGALVCGTAALAVMANLYELLCTAGFPMVFTRALTLHDLPPAQYYLYLAAYNVVYVIPLLAIVLAFVFTLGSRKLTDEEGRVLKLFSGLMMLALGGTLLIRPEALSSIFVSAGLLLGVVVAGVVIVRLRHFGKAEGHGR